MHLSIHIYVYTGSNQCSSKYKNNNNISTISCCLSGYNASIGWDPVTGWGSISLSDLITLFEPVFSGPSTAPTIPAPATAPTGPTTTPSTLTSTSINMPPSPEPSLSFESSTEPSYAPSVAADLTSTIPDYGLTNGGA